MAGNCARGGIEILTISRRRLAVANRLLYGGLCLIFVSIPSMLFLGGKAIYLLVVGSLIGFTGAVLTEELYRCPQCRTNLLTGSRLERLFGKTAKYCPNCGLEIKIEVE